MKKIIILLFIISIAFSCNKKEVKVPRVAMQGAEDIYNNSRIWMFYGEDGKLNLNEKNRISSTHWLFNIDKKLALKEFMPELNKLKIKHSEKSPHNTKPMNNYFTYVNSLNDHLSFYQFDSINYKIIDKSKLPKFSSDTLLFEVNSVIKETPEIEKSKIIQTIFDSDLSFQDYLASKAILEKEIGKENISRVEYIISK